MELPKNRFKQAIARGEHQLGFWCTLTDGIAAEIAAGAGFDWILLDTEHSPADPITVLSQLQAVEPYPVSPIVRPAINDPVLIKRFLDIGAQTLLIPYVQSAAEAERAVAAMRFPPEGIRGVASLTRASRFGRIKDYGVKAADELCLLVQAETRQAIDVLEEIATVDGVDGVFLGPSDLAASYGHVGQNTHPEVIGVIEDAIRRLKKVGKAAGILTPDQAFAKRCMELGTVFTAVGVDAGVLARGAEALSVRFRNPQ